jgi:hypothetical protein
MMGGPKSRHSLPKRQLDHAIVHPERFIVWQIEEPYRFPFSRNSLFYFRHTSQKSSPLPLAQEALKAPTTGADQVVRTPCGGILRKARQDHCGRVQICCVGVFTPAMEGGCTLILAGMRAGGTD